MNINKKLSQNGEHETAAGIDLFKSSNTGELMYKTEYGKDVVIADHTYVEKSMEKVLSDVKDGFVLDFKKDSVGPKVSFTKVNGADIDQPENRDIIIPGVIEITRGNSGGGIFNYALEEGFNASSPAGTTWNTQFIDATNTTWAPLSNIHNRSFSRWRDAITMPSGGQAPPQYVGLKTIMRFDNPETGYSKYWLLEFTYWGIGEDDDYGFGYERYEIFPEVYFEQPSAIKVNQLAISDIISEGVHLTKYWGNSNLYNALFEDYSNAGVSPKNTRWNSLSTDSRTGYSGFDDLTNVKSRVYTDFRAAVVDNIYNGLVMHDLTTDLYWAIQFNTWDTTEAYPGQISDWGTRNVGSGYEDGEAMLTATGGTGEACFIYVTITDGVPAITYLNGGNDYTIGDILTFGDGVTEDPMTIEIVNIYQVGGYSYYRQVIPQGDAIKFADGTELDTAPVAIAAKHEVVIDDNGNTIIDNTADNLVYIPDGMNPEDFKQEISKFSGMLIINDHFDGRVETWIAGGGDTVLLGATNLGGDPCGSTLTINGDVSGYEWVNVDRLMGPFTFTVVKTRSEA